jgi:transcription elongation GreA/GreB family factor
MTSFGMFRRAVLKHKCEGSECFAMSAAALILRRPHARIDDSDLSENAEYRAAKDSQALNEARIVELEDKLARAELIDVSKLSGDTVKFGATVTLVDEDTGEKQVWQVVGEPEADARPFSQSVEVILDLQGSLRICRE